MDEGKEERKKKKKITKKNKIEILIFNFLNYDKD